PPRPQVAREGKRRLDLGDAVDAVDALAHAPARAQDGPRTHPALPRIRADAILTASRIFAYPVHRHRLPERASRAAASVGDGSWASRLAPGHASATLLSPLTLNRIRMRLPFACSPIARRGDPSASVAQGAAAAPAPGRRSASAQDSARRARTAQARRR